MAQSKEHVEWVNCNRPEIEEKPEWGLLLKEIRKGHRRPSVYLIWEREIGAVQKIGIVCICSTRELAERRVKGMNSSDFWSGSNFTKPTTYMIEECEIDHLFAAEMLGYDIELDRTYDQMAQSNVAYWMTQGYLERFQKAAVKKFEEYDARIAELERLLAEANARAEAAENRLLEEVRQTDS
jgi:hypothetical protein